MPSSEDIARAADQARAQFHSIREMVAALEAAETDCAAEIADHSLVDQAYDAIREDALSVQVRGGWCNPGDVHMCAAVEYEILLCTGGPAVRIIGSLSEHGEPETAAIQFQDWFTPWTDWRGEDDPNDKGARIDPEPTLLEYARCFYFGEG